MKRGEPKRLTGEDRILWSRVARTATPLPGKNYPEEEASSPEKQIPPARPSLGKADSAVRPAAVEQAGPGARQPHRLDMPTRQKLARGRIEIGGSVDLHGLTQEKAHDLLLSFLRQAHAGKRRHVLVITGKGSGGGEGVLRRAVPQWLSAPPFSQIVSGYDEAGRRHGGAGALYVRLRRVRDRR